MLLPRLYAILDSSCLDSRDGLRTCAEDLVAAGVSLVEYRNKSGNSRVMLDQARELKRLIGRRTKLIMNDRTDLCLAADYEGVHLGQDDLSPDAARKLIGKERLLGLSTHNPDQLSRADLSSANYLAIGPVFATTSKEKADPVVGLEGVRKARALTRKPLVAIGGITRANCRSVIDAGADAVAVISDLLPDPRKSAEEFLRILR
jgi:thiamine-phosphate pyrophosphorylase